MPDRFHRHRIDHLLVKPGVRFRWSKAKLRQRRGVVQVYRSITTSRGGIDVHHFEVFADRARLKFLPFELECRLVELEKIGPRANQGIEGENPQLTGIRRRYGGVCGEV